MYVELLNLKKIIAIFNNKINESVQVLDKWKLIEYFHILTSLKHTMRQLN